MVSTNPHSKRRTHIPLFTMSRATDGESTALFNASSGNHNSVYGTNGRTHANGNYKRSSQRWRFLMAIGLAFFVCVVFLFVSTSFAILRARRVNRTNDCCDSLDQTGRSMIVPAYQSMSQDIHRLFPNTTTISNMMEPPEVEDLRKSILRVRDLIDIFSPIFPNRSKVSSSSPETLWNHRHHTKWQAVHATPSRARVVELDVWSILRSQLDAGYTIIGQYQDLDHSHINYTMQLNHRLRREVLQWKNQFIQNTTALILIRNRNISLSGTGNTNDAFLQFLQVRHDNNHRRRTPGYTHRKESRLFWSKLYAPPNLDDCACSSLRRLIQKQQQLARYYYQRAFAHESVEDEVAHTDFQYVVPY
jgi:hypothetical protein